MRAHCLVSFLAFAGLASAQSTVRPEEAFGLNASAIVRMGHAEFVAFYCAPERGSTDGLGGAERVYALALHERTQPRLAHFSQADQKFFDEIRAGLADLAKSSVVQGILFTGDAYNKDLKWSIAMQRSVRLVNEAIWQMVRPRLAVPETPDALVRIQAMGERVSAFGEARGIARAETGRVAYLCQSLLKRSHGRPARDQHILQNTMLALGQLALLDDTSAGG